MLATKQLPANYQEFQRINFSSRRTSLWLNIAAIPLLIFFSWLFNYLAFLLRNSYPYQSAWNLITSFPGWNLLILLLTIVMMLVVHELIHGLFFGIFTRTKPKFALRSGYAFAAAPDWFLPRLQYVWVGLSPLVLISIATIFFSWISLPSVLPYVLLVGAFNAAGSLGDMLVAGWTLLQPSAAMINDQGDKFTSFAPIKE